MPGRLTFGLLLIVAILAAGCGSSGGGTQLPTGGTTAAPATAGATAGPSLAPPPTTGGGTSPGTGGTTGIPAIVAGPFSTGAAHIVITGDQNVTFDARGAGVAMGTEAVLTYLDEAAGYSAQLTLSGQTTSGIMVSGKDLLAGGTWGKECQITVTRNDATELAGEFACRNMHAVGSLLGKQLTITLAGTFTATR